jgi:hypothetical protein
MLWFDLWKDHSARSQCKSFKTAYLEDTLRRGWMKWPLESFLHICVYLGLVLDIALSQVNFFIIQEYGLQGYDMD